MTSHRATLMAWTPQTAPVSAIDETLEVLVSLACKAREVYGAPQEPPASLLVAAPLIQRGLVRGLKSASFTTLLEGWARRIDLCTRYTAPLLPRRTGATALSQVGASVLLGHLEGNRSLQQPVRATLRLLQDEEEAIRNIMASTLQRALEGDRGDGLVTIGSQSPARIVERLTLHLAKSQSHFAIPLLSEQLRLSAGGSAPERDTEGQVRLFERNSVSNSHLEPYREIHIACAALGRLEDRTELPPGSFRLGEGLRVLEESCAAVVRLTAVAPGEHLAAFEELSRSAPCLELYRVAKGLCSVWTLIPEVERTHCGPRVLVCCQRVLEDPHVTLLPLSARLALSQLREACGGSAAPRQTNWSVSSAMW